MPAAPRPVSIDQISEEVITISWDDDHQSIYFIKELRKRCPCARCAAQKGREQGQGDPLHVISASLDRVRLIRWEMVGRYAVAFYFSDGHKTGIYTYEYLRSICQCDECDTEGTIRIQGPLKQGD
jgi:DUF971 family protein